MVSISGGVGRFVPMVMLVDRGDATSALGIFQILVSYSHTYVECQLRENDSKHLWILSKMAGNRKKIVLTVIEKLQLTENFENKELATEIAKEYRVGIKRLHP
jgi:hypothetical protein